MKGIVDFLSSLFTDNETNFNMSEMVEEICDIEIENVGHTGDGRYL